MAKHIVAGGSLSHFNYLSVDFFFFYESNKPQSIEVEAQGPIFYKDNGRVFWGPLREPLKESSQLI